MKNLYLLVAVCSLFLSTRVQAQIVCGMNLNSKTGCSPMPILATGNEISLYPIQERKWQLRNQNGQLIFATANGLNNNFSYIAWTDTCLTYYVTLWSKNTNGDTCSLTDTVRVYAPPKFLPVVSPANGVLPLTVSLYPNVKDCAMIDSFAVDWGCGTFSSFSFAPDTVLHTFVNCQLGCISPKIVAHSTSGCWADTTLNNAVCVGNIPVAKGYVNNDTLSCLSPPTVLQFYDTSTFHSSGLWDFGDGTTSTVDTTLHVYNLPGIYVIRRTVCLGQYCDTAIIDTIVVLGPYLANYNLSLSGLCACKDTLVASIQTVGASSLSYTWGCNTGFGHIDSIVPVGTATNPTSVNLEVSYCVTDSCQIQILLHDSLGCTTYTNLPWVYVDTPAVKFNITRQNACVDGNFCFEDLTTYATGTDSTISWLWNFGDGTTDTVQNPCHYYASQGTYAVTLTGLSANGCAASFTDTVRNDFSLNPQADFIFTFLLNYEVGFEDVSTGTYHFLQWQFGDGSSSQIFQTPGATVTKVYNFPTSYNVRLMVWDSLGCADTTLRMVYWEGINETNLLGVVFRPNPFNSSTALHVEDISEPFEFTLQNVLGEKLLIKQGKPNEPLRIDRDNLPAGVYLYEVKIRSGLKATGKLVVE